MAAGLTHDIVDYCVSNGSPVYVCALDAEGAFDGIPHAVMFSKAMGVVPTLYWRLLVYWYSRLVVYIKWGQHMGDAIFICKGTRQGGLSSPFIFNLLYQDMVNSLSNMTCGIAINGVTYNLCCYADDLLLCSLTVTGLQKLKDEANMNITTHGLCFNPTKTKCVTFGKCLFSERKWELDGVHLDEVDHVIHLGVVLANNATSHARIKATRRAFYALQGAGLCVNGTNPDTITHIYSTAVRPVLLYGLECVYQTKSIMHEVETVQSKLLKAALGLKRYCRSTPLLQALKIQHIYKSVEIQELVLFRSMLLSSSRSYQFYRFLLSQKLKGTKSSPRNILARISSTCDRYEISLVKYICNEQYITTMKSSIKKYAEDGIADSISFMLQNLSSQTRPVINALLSSFWCHNI
jgi:hypothetical protein